MVLKENPILYSRDKSVHLLHSHVGPNGLTVATVLPCDQLKSTAGTVLLGRNEAVQLLTAVVNCQVVIAFYSHDCALSAVCFQDRTITSENAVQRVERKK